jgi:hypothetical protein
LRFTYLVLDIAAITPLVYLDAEGVKAVNIDMFGDIKLARVSGTLRIANVMAVEPARKA